MNLRSALLPVLVVALVVTAVGMPLVLLTSPVVTRSLSERYSLADEAGLSRERMTDLAEDVRAFVSGGQNSLPARVDGRAGFDQGAVAHLLDVRAALRWGRVAALLGAAFALVTLAFLRRDPVVERRAFGWAAVTTIAPMAVLGIAGAVDFDAFFSAFHGVFFAPGTWTFPWDSLLIQLFPERFWLVAALSWALCTLVIAVAYAAAWFVLGRSARAKHESGMRAGA